MALQSHQLQALTAGLPLPAPLPRKKRDNEEWRIQSDFFSWWRNTAPGLKIWPGLLFHVPNGSMLGDTKQGRIIRAKMLKSAGMVSGVVDCFLSVPVQVKTPHLITPSRWLHGCYIEFKKPLVRTMAQGGLSDAQQEFIGYAMGRGYACHVCYSWEEARDVVLDYLRP